MAGIFTALGPLVPKAGWTRGVLQADKLRRQDGLELEDVLRRLNATLAGLGESDVASLIAALDERIAALEDLSQYGAVWGHCAFQLTGTGTASSFTLRQTNNLRVSTLSASAITLAFDVPVPNQLYNVAWVAASGSATASSHTIQAETVTGMQLIMLTGAVTVNPQTATGEYVATVIGSVP